VQLKTQFGYAFLLNLRESSKERATLAPSNSDTALVASRLVLVY
jgi:hypothetical protein